MYPLEMKFNKDNIGTIDINDVVPLIRKPLYSYSYETKGKMVPNKSFYLLPSTSDYLLRVNKYRENDNELFEFISRLREKQLLCPKTDFPIGVVLNEYDKIGQIIRYYKDAKSLKNICINEDLASLQKYISCDDDVLHNFFLACLQIIDILEELFAEGIAYFDVGGDNFVIHDGNVKIIDFEEKYIKFDKSRFSEFIILHNYFDTLYSLIKTLGFPIYYESSREETTFSKVRKHVKIYENRVRENCHY